MGDSSILLYVRRNGSESRADGEDVQEELSQRGIEYKVIDISEKLPFYNNLEITIEGAFAFDFSNLRGVRNPVTPLLLVGNSIFNGKREILSNLDRIKIHR